MKRVLMLICLAMMLSPLTGCAAKKRVKALEAELSRCRQKKAELSETTVQQPPATEEFAQATNTPE